jgi:hypothetical protein
MPGKMEIIADNLSKAGWSWGCVSAIDREGRAIWITDAHRDDGKRFVVRAGADCVCGTRISNSASKLEARPQRRSKNRLAL